MDFYVYAYLREDGSPYYIGKGKRNRINEKRNHSIKLPSPERRKKLFEQLTEQESFDIEKKLINHYGKKIDGTGILRNLTDGGTGGDTSMSPNYIKALNKRKLEGNYTAWNKGVSTPRTPESIEKQRKTITGKKRGPYENFRYDLYQSIKFRGKEYTSASAARKDTGASYYTIKKYGKPLTRPPHIEQQDS